MGKGVRSEGGKERRRERRGRGEIDGREEERMGEGCGGAVRVRGWRRGGGKEGR